MAAMDERKDSTSTRLYVGGLGERVTEDDLRNTFSNLGSLQTVDIIRTKGRSFAYIDFLPSSDNSLVKLFSTYNGCSWKGGKLKLEKAKEHYVDRMKREWAEEAELKNREHIVHGDGAANKIASPEPKSPLDLEKMEFRLFFPKLRKMKSLPLRGTGKHKYSFQRLPAPPVPVHLCDCPEHSVPVHTAKVARVHSNPVHAAKVARVHSDPVQSLGATPGDNSNAQNDGIDEEEFSMMNSVINRILGQESAVNDSKLQDGGVTQEEIDVMNSALRKVLDKEISLPTEQPDLHTSPQTASISEAEEKYIDDGTDDDDIKINAVAGRNHGSLSSSWERRRSLDNQMPRSNERQNHGNLARQNRPGFLSRNISSSDRKRKSLANETNEDDSPLPVHEMKPPMQAHLTESEEATMKSDAQKSTGRSVVSEKATQGSSSKRKSSWTQLIGGGSNSSFSISQILP